MVTVADGSKTKCHALHWSIDGEEFTAEMRVLPLGGYNMILGVQWMKQVGLVTLDMNHLTLGVYKNNKQVILKGGPRTEPALQIITGVTLFRMCAQRECGFIGQLHYKPPETHGPVPTPTEIQPLLTSYQSLFVEPKGLPPIRPHEHAIPPQTQCCTLHHQTIQVSVCTEKCD